MDRLHYIVPRQSAYVKGPTLSHSLTTASDIMIFKHPVLPRRKNTTISVDQCHLLGLAKLGKSPPLRTDHMDNSHDQDWQLESSHQQI